MIPLHSSSINTSSLSSDTHNILNTSNLSPLSSATMSSISLFLQQACSSMSSNFHLHIYIGKFLPFGGSIYISKSLYNSIMETVSSFADIHSSFVRTLFSFNTLHYFIDDNKPFAFYSFPSESFISTHKYYSSVNNNQTFFAGQFAISTSTQQSIFINQFPLLNKYHQSNKQKIRMYTFHNINILFIENFLLSPSTYSVTLHISNPSLHPTLFNKLLYVLSTITSQSFL